MVRNGERAGEQCSRGLGAGTGHPGVGYCSKHGGNTPAGRKAAARAYGRQLILDHKERFGGDRDDPAIRNITAESALVEELRRSVAMVRWLEGKISTWQINSSPSLEDAGELGLPRLVEETSKGAPGMTDVQAWLVLYREERKHAAQIAKMCIDANISKRMLNIAEMQGGVLSKIVSGVLKELRLSEVQAQMVPTVVPGIIQRASAELASRYRPDDALQEVNDLPALPTVYKVTNV